MEENYVGRERNITLTYNGEIYNYIELRSELEQLGYKFHTTSDTEVLLHAYCQWGEECIKHFNGMWSFALWDGLQNKLFCARDRLGAKPFHYYWKGNRFLFGSELKQMCQDETMDLKFCRPYLAANLMYHITDYSEETLIQDIHVLKPGHQLIVQLDSKCQRICSVHVAPYWTLQVNYDYTFNEKQWIEIVGEEFSRACKWRMRSDAPLAALLSGGLDSSCMVTEMCQQMTDPGKLHTFTTHYPGDTTCDEWDFADKVNHSCGCVGYAFTPVPNAIESHFQELIWNTEGIGYLSLLGSQLLLKEISKQGFKVLLNGQCGDEVMLGYERYYAFYFANLLRQRKIDLFRTEFALAGKHSRLGLGDIIGYYAYFNFPWIRNTRQYKRAKDVVQKDLLKCRNHEQLQQLLFPKTMEQLQYTELTATQLTHIVRYDDRINMAASLESRIPFMDYKFVELACKIPPEQKIKNGYTKYLMRKIFETRMPLSVTWRTNKMGFGAPVKSWASQFSKEYLMDRIQNAKTAQYFNRSNLEKMSLNYSLSQTIIDFLSIEEFARQFHVR